MDKRKKKSMKIFEHRSSDETARDPFEDDGEYGSDNNYEPSEEDSYSDSNLSESFVLPIKRSRVGGALIRKKTRKSQSHARRGNNINSPSKSLHTKQVLSKNTNTGSSFRSVSSGADSQSSESDSEASEDLDDSNNKDSHSSCQGSLSNLSETENNVGTNEQHDESDYEIANSSDSEIFPLAKRLKRQSNDTVTNLLQNDYKDESASCSMRRLSQNNPELRPLRCSPQGAHENEPKLPPVRQLLQADPDLGPVHRSPQDDLDLDSVRRLSPLRNEPKSPSLHHLFKSTPELPSTHHSPSSHVSHASEPKSPSDNRLTQDHPESTSACCSRLDNQTYETSSFDNVLPEVQQSPRLKSPSKSRSSKDDSAPIQHSPHAGQVLVPETPSPCHSLQVSHLEVLETPTVSNLSGDGSAITPVYRSLQVDHVEVPETPSVCHSSRYHSEPAFFRPSSQIDQRYETDTRPGQNDLALPSTNRSPQGSPREEPELPSSVRGASTIDEEWSATISPIPDFNFDDNSVGIRFPVDETTTVVDIFNRVFPPEIVDYIMECTNAYGLDLCKRNRPKTRNSRSYIYKEVDREELLKFLGLCLLSGHVATPQKRKLFTMSDPLYYHPIFVSVLSGRRYEQILRCLNVASPDAKGLEKVSAFMDFVTRNFRLCYKPEKELSLDESLLLFKGRLTCKQYIKSKRARYGIKFYELTTSSAYVLNMLMYSGKVADTTEKGKKVLKTVLRLMRPYILKGHSLYMDNYYNSIELSQKLLDLKTHSTGTLRVNRKGNPKRLLSKKLKKGNHVWAKRNRIYVSKWVDKRPVNMITTEYHPELVEITNRRGQPKTKPREVVQYNKFMSGVDRVDQMVSYYSSPRKTIRWYKKVFFHLLDIAVWNSFFLFKKYCKNNDKSYEFIAFREELIRNLIQIEPVVDLKHLIRHSKYSNRKGSNEQNPVVAPADSSNGGHWPEKIPVPLGSKKKSNYLKCKMCKKNNQRRETGLRCKGCDDKPALCALCFDEWHSQLNN